MEKFVIRDFYIQTGFIIAFFISLFLDLAVFQKGICVIIYFLLAINHLISSNTRFFSKNYSKSVLFKIYYYVSMTFMLSFISLLLIGNFKFSNEYVSELWYSVLSFGLFGTPVLAVIYYLICNKDYDQLKVQKNNNHENA